jgi:predicted secreted protein
MKRKTAVATFATVTALLVYSTAWAAPKVALSPAPGPSGAPTARSLTVTQKQDGQEVVLGSGEMLVLRLEAIPGTGYGWQIAMDASPQLVAVGGPVFEPTGTAEAGGVENEVFQFRAQTPGSSHLMLEYRRPWEKRAASTRTFQVRVIVE